MSHFETDAIRIQQRSNQREHSSALYLSSSFVFESAEEARAMFAEEIQGNIYSRYSNPNSSDLIEKVCNAEGTEDGIATASGMAAMFGSIASLLQQGDHILASRSLFGSTHQLLTRVFPKWGITSTYGDISDYQNWEQLLQPNTKMLFLETPSNPGLEIIDLEWAGKFAEAHGLILVVDNCFATPYLQQPAKWGAHLVTHSDLAIKQMKAGGGILTLTVKGGLQRAQRFIDKLQMISITPNLGDSRSIVTHPTSTTHSKLSAEERQKVGITDGLIRLSVGLEHYEDILKDVERALEQSK